MPHSQRKFLLQARLYRMLSILFVFTGLIIFISLYLKNIEGRLLEALSEPATVTIIIFPFVPAIVLSVLAKSSEKKYLSIKDQSKSEKANPEQK